MLCNRYMHRCDACMHCTVSEHACCTGSLAFMVPYVNLTLLQVRFDYSWMDLAYVGCGSFCSGTYTSIFDLENSESGISTHAESFPSVLNGAIPGYPFSTSNTSTCDNHLAVADLVEPAISWASMASAHRKFSNPEHRSPFGLREYPLWGNHPLRTLWT